jgi:hypothetical protein
LDNVLHYEELGGQQEDWLMNATRGTLRLEGRTREHVSFKLGVVARVFQGSTLLELPPFMPAHIYETLVPADPEGALPGTDQYLQNGLSSQFYLQEAYGDLAFPLFRARLGRQKVETGTGYAFNPTDLFNRKNPIDPTYEVDGIDAALAAFQVSTNSKLSLLVASQAGAANYLGRLDTNIQQWEVAFQYSSVVRPRVDWETINTPYGLSILSRGASIPDFARAFRWHQVAGEFSMSWRAIRLYGEGGIAFIERPEDIGTFGEEAGTHERLLVGADHAFESGARIILEYMRLGQGRTADSPIRLNDLMGYYTGEMLSTNKDTVFSELSCPIAKSTELSLTLLLGSNHPAFFINPWFHFDLAPGLRVSFSFYQAVGAKDGQYARVGPGGYARMKFEF